MSWTTSSSLAILCEEVEILTILHLSFIITEEKKILTQFISNMFSTKNKIMHVIGEKSYEFVDCFSMDLAKGGEKVSHVFLIHDLLFKYHTKGLTISCLSIFVSDCYT